MRSLINIEKTSILLVEGKDEVNFFDMLLKFLNIPNVQSIDVGGVYNFKNKFSVLSKQEKFRDVDKIAFIRDADKQAESALDSLKSSVQSADVRFSINDISLANNNNIKDINGVCCGIYIMPDNQSSGMLEDLCIKYMKTDSICHCVEKYISCVRNNGGKNGEKFEFKNESKSIIFSYLSTKLADSPSIGRAAQKNVFDFNNKCFCDIKNFLSKMFS
ncbi:MAG: hypothetical protein LE178_02995 [Endomicrobium sp.]|nr:hypothetical protein [Endomicrobium sp.]